jgi:RNA polymerase sigma-70 factor, ECF subfamily
MKQYGEEIKRIIYTFVKNWPQAEDLTQDVFVTLYTRKRNIGWRSETDLQSKFS